MSWIWSRPWPTFIRLSCRFSTHLTGRRSVMARWQATSSSRYSGALVPNAPPMSLGMMTRTWLCGMFRYSASRWRLMCGRWVVNHKVRPSPGLYVARQLRVSIGVPPVRWQRKRSLTT